MQVWVFQWVRCWRPILIPTQVYPWVWADGEHLPASMHVQGNQGRLPLLSGRGWLGKVIVERVRVRVMACHYCYNFFPFPCLFLHQCSTTSLLLFRSILHRDRPLLTCFPWLLFPCLVSSLVSLCSTGLSHSLVTSLMVTTFPPPSIGFYNVLLR